MFNDGTTLSFWDQWGSFGGLCLCILCFIFPRLAMIVAVCFGNLGVGILGLLG